jgi:hypothetical protein
MAAIGGAFGGTSSESPPSRTARVGQLGSAAGGSRRTHSQPSTSAQPAGEGCPPERLRHTTHNSPRRIARPSRNTVAAGCVLGRWFPPLREPAQGTVQQEILRRRPFQQEILCSGCRRVLLGRLTQPRPSSSTRVPVQVGGTCARMAAIGGVFGQETAKSPPNCTSHTGQISGETSLG